MPGDDNIVVLLKVLIRDADSKIPKAEHIRDIKRDHL